MDTSADAHHPHETHIPHMSEYSAHMLDRRIFRNRMANPNTDRIDVANKAPNLNRQNRHRKHCQTGGTL